MVNILCDRRQKYNINYFKKFKGVLERGMLGGGGVIIIDI
jgi:hypothetical protein